MFDFNENKHKSYINRTHEKYLNSQILYYPYPTSFILNIHLNTLIKIPVKVWKIEFFKKFENFEYSSTPHKLLNPAGGVVQSPISVRELP